MLAAAMILEALGISYDVFFSTLPTAEDIIGDMTMYISTFLR